MKSVICLLIGLCFATQCLASLSESELTTIQRFLGPSLMRIFNTTTVDAKRIEKFLEKNEFMAKYLSKFADDKKKAIREMPGSFFQGLLYPQTEKLNAYEKLSAEAFIENKDYHNNFKLFRKNFPAPQCDSANYTMAVLNFQKRVDWESFDPMTLYFGIMGITNNIDGETEDQKTQLEVGLKNMTDGLSQLEEAIKKAASNIPGDTCVDEIIKVIEEFKGIFVSAETLKSKIDAFKHKNECCPIEKLSKIASQIDHYYFESITSSTMAFRLAATDLGELLLKLA